MKVACISRIKIRNNEVYSLSILKSEKQMINVLISKKEFWRLKNKCWSKVNCILISNTEIVKSMKVWFIKPI